MTQEEKDLLLKDLSARLPYGVICYDEVQKENGIFKTFEYEGFGRIHNGRGLRFIENIKPYLFPLSSMTEEQYDEFEKIVSDDYLENIQITKEMRERVDFITHFPIYCPNVIDWFNKNHFDYRGLIKKGLAIDASGLKVY